MKSINKALKVMKFLEEMGKKNTLSLLDIKKYRTIESAAKHKKLIPSIGPIKGKIIEDLIKKYKPKKILEIGTLFGYSAILMARLLPSEGKVVTLEKSENNIKIAKKNIIDSGLSDKINPILGDALETIPKITEKFDFFFIDAQKDKYFDYLKLAEKNLKKGSIIVADNACIFKEQMSDYLKYVKRSGNYNTKTIKTLLEFSKDIKDAIEVSIKVR